MSSVGYATLEVIPSLKGIEGAISSQLGGVASGGKRAGSAFSGGFRSVVGTIAAGVAALGIGRLTSDMVSFGLKTYSANEQASIGFTTMLGSARKARVFLDQMKDFAAKTPFEFPELQTAASSLISVGVQTSKVLPIMKTLGDVTSGMGTGSEGIKRATIALQQMNAAQRITGEDLNQLRDAGIPVYDLLAAATGKSKAAVVELARAGELGKKELDAMMKALESGKGLERFAGLMDKQSQSLQGLWSTLKDTLGQGLADAIQKSGAAEALKGGIGAATVWLANVALPALTKGLTWLVSVGKNVAAGLQGAGWGQLKDQMGALVPVIRDGLGAAARWLGDNALPLAQGAMDGIRSAMESMKPVAQAAGQGLQFLADHADVIGKALPFIVTGFVAMRAAQQANELVGRNSVIGLALQIASNTALAVSNFALAAATRASTSATITDTAARSGGLFARVATTAATIAATAATVASSVASKAAAAGQWLLNAALSANPIGIVVVALAALAAGLIWAYQNSAEFRAVVDGAFRAVGAAATWLWQNAILPMVAKVQQAMAALAPIIRGAMTVVQGIIKTVMSLIRGDWAGAWAGVQQIAGGAIAALKGVISAGLSAIAGFFGGLPGRIKGALGNLGGILLGAGKAIMNGFLNGLRSAWGAVQSFVGGIADWIAAHKGPLSYDAQLLQPAGRAIMGGLVDSMRGGMPALAGVVGDVTNLLGSPTPPTFGAATWGPISGGRSSSAAADLRAALDGARIDLGNVDRITNHMTGTLVMAARRG